MWHSTARFPTRFFHSVRFRLTLWYLAILTVVLCAFGLTVYYAQQHTLTTQFDGLLRTRIQQIASTYNATTQRLDIATPVLQKPTTGKATASTISAASRGLNFDEVGVLLSPDGRELQVLGYLSPASVAAIESIAFKSSPPLAGGYVVTLPDLPLTLTTTGKTTEYGLVGMPILQQGRIVAYLTFGMPSPISPQLASLAMTLLVAGAVVLLLAAVGGFWLANRAMRPIQAITTTAQQIGASDLSRRLGLKRRDEVGELADTFDTMLDRLEKAFIRQRQFTADASHELRTPLTIIELEADRLLDQPETTERQHASLAVIQQERAHMTRLVDDLLLLARADTGYATVGHEAVHLDELILEVVERFAALAGQRQMRVQVDALPDLVVLGDRLYLARMLGNLIENALKYSGPDGTQVTIALAPLTRDDGEWACLTVNDDGQGIAAEHLPRVFERFYRADASRSHSGGQADVSEHGGSGLGLAIAQWIAQAHGGDITIQSDAGKGTVCTVLLPLHAGCY